MKTLGDPMWRQKEKLLLHTNLRDNISPRAAILTSSGTGNSNQLSLNSLRDDDEGERRERGKGTRCLGHIPC